MFDFNPENAGNLFLILVVYGGVVLAVFLLAMIFWTYRDMRARSRDRLGQLLVTVMVAVLNFPGLLIYILLRPRETLSEAYERSLEEEELLQEIEEKPTCPGCGQRTQPGWQICPHCQTRLKKTCISCGKMLELSWNICPYCATPQASFTREIGTISDYSQSVSVSQPRNRRRSSPSTTSDPQASRSSTSGSSSLEFIDGE
jgi:hypothetical protein